MRRIAFIIFVLTYSIVIKSQIISPYYPSDLRGKNNRYETPMTYVELNHVSNRVQLFMNDVLDMTMGDGYPKFNDNSLKEVYVDKVSINRTPSRLTIEYSTFSIGHDYVVKNVKISGDKVIEFFVRFWNTTMSFNEVKEKGIVHYVFLQDKSTLYYNHGNCYIEVINTTINNASEFKVLFTRLQHEYLEKQKKDSIQKVEKQKAIELKREKERLEAERKREEERELRRNTKAVAYKYVINKSKKKFTFKPNGGDPDEYADPSILENIIGKWINDKKPGTYSVIIKHIIQYDSIAKTDIELLYYKPKGSSLTRYLY